MRQNLFTLILCFTVLPSVSAQTQKASSIWVSDTRNVDEPPSSYSQEVRADLKFLSTTGISTAYGFSTNLTISPWADGSAGYTHQLSFNNNGVYYRNGDYSSTWNGWKKLLMSDLSGNVEIGNKNDNSYTEFIIHGPNAPLGESSRRDILFKFQNAGQSGIRAYRGHEYGTFLQFMTTQPGENPAQPRVRMHIDEYGKIGINTLDPQSELDVNGKIITKSIRSIGDFQFDNSVPIDNWGSKLWFSHFDDNSDPVLISRFNKSSDASELRVSIGDCPDARDKFSVGYVKLGNNLEFTPVFSVQADGKVGVMTNNPQNALDVNGTIRAKEIKVESLVADNSQNELNINATLQAKGIKIQSDWADFVFKKGYNLPTLQEVEQHITENGTLPGVPSEEEVKANGVDVGKVNALLLQKIEELTLYIIDMKKEIDELKQENVK